MKYGKKKVYCEPKKAVIPSRGPKAKPITKKVK